MDLGSVPPPGVLDALESIATALTEAAEGHAATSGIAADAHVPLPGTAAAPLLAREGLAERLLGPLPTPSDPSNAPARHVEHGAETAAAQTFGRTDQTPQAQRDAQGRPADAMLSNATEALGGFALPTDQLVQASLIGLQVQPGWTQPLPLPATPQEEPAAPPRREAEQHDPTPEDEADAEEEESEEVDDEMPDEVLDPADDDDDCEALIRTLRAALLSVSPSHRLKGTAHSLGAGADAALVAILDQWQRGRCVVIACPQGIGPEGPAWAFVMRPRRAFTYRPDGRSRIALAGRRVAARLQWRQPPRGAHWLHGRMAKDHQPQRGRQLVALPGMAPVCEVQLGPVLAERRRPCEVRLRIDAVRRFWGALGDQWSVLVVVCSLPLASRPASEVPPC